MLVGLALYAIGIFALYLVVKVAVRHGIDESETGKIIRQRRY